VKVLVEIVPVLAPNVTFSNTAVPPPPPVVPRILLKIGVYTENVTLSVLSNNVDGHVQVKLMF
jgi:hypothetical protein